MEKPHYGRTGLLASRLAGLPVTQPRLFVSSTSGAASASRALKWYPSLLTMPQQLLDALHREDEELEESDVSFPAAHEFSADPTLVTYLRVATMAEALLQRWRYKAIVQGPTAPAPNTSPPSRAQVAGLYASVLKWSREKVHAATTTASASTRTLAEKHNTFYIPSYKLLVMKNEAKVTEYVGLTRRAVWLLGKEPGVNDILLEHPSCSAQHAALEMRFVLMDESPLNRFLDTHMESDVAAIQANKLNSLCEGMWDILMEQQELASGDATKVWTVELQLIDLGSTNSTKLNGVVVAAAEATTVIESDVMEFGCSTRKYVVLRNA
jgi:hypothetical protein